MDRPVGIADGSFWAAAWAQWLALGPGERLGLAVAAIVLSLIFAAFLATRAFGRKALPAFPAPEAQVAQGDKAPGAPGLSPPDGLFPGQWFEGVDGEKLDAYLAKAKREAVRDFLEALACEPGKPPGPEKLAAATERLARSLNRLLTAPGLFAALNGGEEPQPRDLALIGLHLNGLLPPIRLPSPEVSPGEIRPLSVGLMALLGAAAGIFAAQAFGAPGPWPALAAACGSALGSVLAIFLSQNDRVRRWLLAAVGGLAFFDAVGTIFSGALLPSLGKVSFFKRLLFYGGAVLVLLLVKGKKAFDLGRYKEAVSARVSDYLAGTLPLLIVLTFRLSQSAEAQRLSLRSQAEAELLGEVAFLLSRARAKPGLGAEPSLSRLARKLENAGFEAEAPPDPQAPRRLEWDESLRDLYEPFGLIENGRKVLIEEEPVYRDGKVIRKGQAVPA
ncbi:MAG: hypothetical protein LBF58_10635 [Deltaproteobacteria bacterium]|jgi:hypothetical protein|nr:hypothetical protein [Deltaproteobacteria bacterium]